MKVFHGRPPEAASEQRTGTFSGTAWVDPIMPNTDNVTIANVFFSPGARTYWHAHEHGQILQVTAGSGFICTEGGTPQPIRSGDVVWILPNERHWHGATETSFLLHVATSIGKTRWHDEVTHAAYTGTPATP